MLARGVYAAFVNIDAAAAVNELVARPAFLPADPFARFLVRKALGPRRTEALVIAFGIEAAVGARFRLQATFVDVCSWQPNLKESYRKLEIHVANI